jgi:hypothetical protein
MRFFTRRGEVKKNIAIRLFALGMIVLTIGLVVEIFTVLRVKAVSVTKDVVVTVAAACEFTQTSPTHSISMSANALNTTMTNTLTVICNNRTGFTTTGTFNSITGTGQAITYSTTNPTAGSGTWTAYSSSKSANIATGGTVLSSNTWTTGSGAQTTMTYKVSTRANQAAGAYTTTVTYTTTQNS